VNIKRFIEKAGLQKKLQYYLIYKLSFVCEVYPESKATKALNMYNIFNLQKLHCE